MQDHCKINPQEYIRFIIKWMMIVLFPIAGIMPASSQVKLILSTPGSEELFISDLWEVQILNNSNEDIQIFLEGSIEEQSKGKIYEGTTKTAKIPANTKYNFNRNELITDSTRYAFPGIDHGKNIFQVFPDGNFTLCTYITHAESMLILDNECIRIHFGYNRDAPD